MAAGTSMRVAVFLGRRAITRGNRGVIALTVALMAVIFAQLMFIPSLIQGATDRLQNELRENLTSSIAITPTGSDLTIANPSALVARARATPGVAAATSTVLAGSQISHGSRVSSWPVLAVEPRSFAATFATPHKMIEGTFLDPGDSDEIVLGLAIAGAGRPNVATYRSSLQNVHAGDRVAVTLLGGTLHVFTVKGIYDASLSQANTRAFITSATAARLVPLLAGRSSAIYLRTDHVGDEQAVVDRLRRARPDVRYETWESLRSTVRDVTGSFDLIKSILNTVSLLVAAITIFIVTYVDLVNRRRTIGIERAIGITSAAIAVSYALKTLVFAAIGVVVGTALFYGAAVPLVRSHPFVFPLGPVSLSPTGQELRRDALVLVVVAVIGALLPVWRTVRTRLLDAIWG